MCGRYAIFQSPQTLKALFGCENLPNFAARYNAAPLQELPVIIKNRMGMARWGFLPPWVAEDNKSLAAKMINARSETIAEKPSFKDSWFKARRCLIPANGFYEWKKDEGAKTKTAYYIHNNNEVMAFAGLWSKTADIINFTILTKQADGQIADIHPRMPVVLSPQQASGWFAGSTLQAMDLIDAASAGSLAFHAVSPDVGKVSNNQESLLQAV